MAVSTVSLTVQFDTLRTVAFGSITNSYTAFGSAFTHPIRQIRIINPSDGDIFISFDGTNNNLFIPASSFVLYDFTTNRNKDADTFALPIGSQAYIKYSTAPTTKSVYLEAVYGRGQ